jgi:HAD superfamily hydrolase (TIGR01549 family)
MYITGTDRHGSSLISCFRGWIFPLLESQTHARFQLPFPYCAIRSCRDFFLPAGGISPYAQRMNELVQPRHFQAVLFDFDGTLTEPGSLDFAMIRNAIGCPKGRPVLEFIHGMSSEAERAEAFRILDDFEAEAARQSRPNRCAEEVIELLRKQNIRIGIISRNSRAAIMAALRNFERILPSHFSVILSRDDPYRPKPSAEGILAAAAMMGTTADHVLVVGDFVFDIQAGQAAGALTAYLTNRSALRPGVCFPDFTLHDLDDLKPIIESHGKFRGQAP